jgi:hypothetical protein
MVRIVLLDEPGGDSALNAVLAKLQSNSGGHSRVIRRVRMLHDGLGRINGDAVFDLRSGLDIAAREFPREAVEGVDFIGHGAPGVLLLGGSSAGGPRTTSHAVREWAQLDSDVNKLPALVPFAKQLRELRANGRLTEGFEVRVLGCNTASDPGVTPSPSLGILQDGPVLIHLLSSFFDSPVTGVIGYIGPENFADGSFQPREVHIRSCAASTTTGTISFFPDSFPPGAPLLNRDTFPLERLLSEQPLVRDRRGLSRANSTSLASLLSLFQPIALPLPTTLPLVIRDASLQIGQVTLDLVEHGKALVIYNEGKAYRSAPLPENRDAAQEAIARFIEQSTAKRPLWADPAAARALYF